MTQVLALVRNTSLVDELSMSRIASAIQVQLNRDFAPIWNLPPVAVDVYESDDVVPSGAYSIEFTDEAPPILDALGDHFQLGTSPTGNIFCQPIMSNSGGILVGAYSVAATASHEAIELLGDPSAQLYMPRSVNSDSFAKELCDPVQGLPYLINGVSVSDFVFPWYFDDGAATLNKQIDFQNALTLPFSLAPEGYCVKKASDGTVSQVFAESRPPAWWLATRIRNKSRLAASKLPPAI